MARTKLFDQAFSESTSRMDFELVLESADNALNEFAELSKQNEQMVIVDIQDDAVLTSTDETNYAGIDESLDVTRVGLNAVNALNDTRLLIAPQIVESTRQDIALVRQVATTAAAGMGIDPAELLPANMDDTVGQPMSLNMEGFKEKAIVALAAIWRFIQNIFDFVLGIFKTNFNLMKIRLAKLVAISKQVNKSKKTSVAERIKADPSWRVLTPEGMLPGGADSIRDMIANLDAVCRVFATTVGTSQLLFQSNHNVKTDGAAEAHEFYMEEMVKLINKLQKSMPTESGGALVMEERVGGGRLKITNGQVAFKDPTGANLGATQLEWVNEPVPDDATDVQGIAPKDLRKIINEFIEVWGEHLRANVIIAANNTANIGKREAEAEAKAYTALLTQTTDDTIIAYVTEIAAMRRSLVTFQWSAFAQFSRTVIDLLNAMTSYVTAQYNAQS